MSFTVEYLQFFLLILVRVSSVIFAAPFFNNRSIPARVKAGFSVFLTFIMINTVDYSAVSYVGIIGYSILVIKEAIAGLIIGMGSGFCMYIISYAGSFIDMEIGLSMAMEFDPTTNIQSTITSNFLSYTFMLLFMVSDLHYFVIDALNDSYKLIPIGEANITGPLYQVMVKYMADYFIIGFRIALPIFACMIVINVILGILARIAPQMNMFVVGIQLKLFIGFVVLYFIMSLFPGIVDFMFHAMQDFTKQYMNILAS